MKGDTWIYLGLGLGAVGLVVTVVGLGDKVHSLVTRFSFHITLITYISRVFRPQNLKSLDQVCLHQEIGQKRLKIFICFSIIFHNLYTFRPIQNMKFSGILVILLRIMICVLPRLPCFKRKTKTSSGCVNNEECKDQERSPILDQNLVTE